MARISDAVVVVPGIMGSELCVKGSNGKDVLWGLSGALLAQTWLHGRFRRLLVTEDDLAGKGSVEATRLLRNVGWTPVLGGLEPYEKLLEAVRGVVVDQSAVVEFPYDWRLPVDVNGRLLADRCHRLLEAWRTRVGERRLGDPEEVRVVIVAHSMGGLVARHAVQRYGASSVVRSILTLGTPHYGAVRALQMLATGEGTGLQLPVIGNVELPRRLQAAGRELALTSPGVYDLLPRYRCVLDVKPRHLTTADVASVGAREDFAIEAAERNRLLVEAPTAPMMGLAGADQPTLQSLKLQAGSCTFYGTEDGSDNDPGNLGGDATVPRRSANPPDARADPLPQRHGALAKSEEAFTFVIDALRGGHLPPRLGTRPISAEIPDAAGAGESITVRVREPESDGPPDAGGLSVTSVDVNDETVRMKWKDRRIVDGTLEFRSPPHPPGVYRVTVAGGSYSAVGDIVLVDEATRDGAQWLYP